MKIYSFIVFFFLLFTSRAFSQDASFLDQYANLKIEKDSLVKVVASDESKIKELRDSLRAQSEEIKRLKSDIADTKVIRKNLEDSIATLSISAKSIEAERKKFDDVRVRYANGRLALPYDDEGIKAALALFSEINDPEILTEYTDVPTCLRDFKTEMIGVHQLMVDLENSRKGYNQFNNAEWKKIATNLIGNNSYTKRKYLNGVSIYYLDNIIKEARGRVEKAGSAKDVSFQDLIIKLEL